MTNDEVLLKYIESVRKYLEWKIVNIIHRASHEKTSFSQHVLQEKIVGEFGNELAYGSRLERLLHEKLERPLQILRTIASA